MGSTSATQPENGPKVMKLPTPPAAPKHRPTHLLPSNRVAFQKQLAILRGYAAASGPDQKPVDLTTLGDFVSMAATTVSLMNGFFADIGLIEKTGTGYAPVPAVLNYGRVYRWDQEKAGPELAPVIKKTWFAEALLPRLELEPMEMGRALTVLANEANADVDYRPKVRILLSYLETAGLIAIEGTQVSALESAAASPPPPEQSGRQQSDPAPAPEPAKMAPSPLGPLPLLIQGLLEQLPSDGTWTRSQARTWLQMAALAFDVVYDLGPDDDRPLWPGDRDPQK